MRMILIPLVIGTVGIGAAATVVMYRQTYHPVSWYQTNQAQAQAQIAWCRENVGLARTDPNCQNAAEAQSSGSWAKFHEMATALPWPSIKAK